MFVAWRDSHRKRWNDMEWAELQPKGPPNYFLGDVDESPLICDCVGRRIEKLEMADHWRSAHDGENPRVHPALPEARSAGGADRNVYVKRSGSDSERSEVVLHLVVGARKEDRVWRGMRDTAD